MDKELEIIASVKAEIYRDTVLAPYNNRYKEAGYKDYKQGFIDGASLREQPLREASFQNRVNDWMQVCFGAEISSDVTERSHRFIEESLELVQSNGITKDECHQLVDYVFGRPKGEAIQEVGGVIVTLAALCNAIGLNIDNAGETELKRIWTKIDKIREKQANKPKHSPLPEAARTALAGETEGHFLTNEELKKKISDAWDAALTREFYEHSTKAWILDEIPPKKKEYLNSLK